MANRLINSTSPYLLQHAHNPVDWHPWGAEAIARARREEKPIFLSIGYAACHWCHVMERECFERPEIAALMNEHFINIKVDREERPDLDDLYMLATQVMSGSGGWPMSVWLTPSLEPFYAGTYFPPTDGYGRPGFPRLLMALSDTWKNRRGTLMEQAEKVVAAIKLHVDESDTDPATGNSTLDTRNWIRLAIEQASDRFDEVNGGPAGAPKFPPHQTLALWTALLVDVEGGVLSSAERGILGGKLAKTLEGMARGGIYDQIGGAFARYSTDERWLVPHFEKMLYDSAQLAPTYAQASLLLDNPDLARVARETLDFFLREMRSAEGAYYSSLDADSEGEEGKYYVWTVSEIEAALAPEEARQVIAYFGMTGESNWHESPTAGARVLAVAEGQTFTPAIGSALEKLRRAREGRVRPGLDDKILTSWNGLMLSALAITGRVLRESKYLQAAGQLADFLLARHVGTDGRLLRTSRDGPAHTLAFLDDYGSLLNGLLDFAEAGDEAIRAKSIARAESLAGIMLADFSDERGGFFFTGPQHEKLFARMKNAADNATPSPNGMAIRALLRLGAATAKPGYRAAALRAVAAFSQAIARRPDYFPTILHALFEESSTSIAVAAVEPKSSDPEQSGILALSAEAIGSIRSGEPFIVTFILTIAPGYHIQPASGSDGTSIKTVARLRAAGSANLAAQNWNFPAPEAIHDTVGYAGSLKISASCTLSGPPGRHPLRATLTAQPCTANACLTPETVTAEVIVTII